MILVGTIELQRKEGISEMRQVGVGTKLSPSTPNSEENIRLHFSQKTRRFGLKDVLNRGREAKHSHDLFLTVYSVLSGL